MKWREPAHGTVRVRTKFAWLPVWTTPDHPRSKVWLERVRITEMYSSYFIFGEGGGHWRTERIEPVKP